MSQETLGTFCTMTNTDSHTAKMYLMATNWNLNQAINRYFSLFHDYQSYPNTITQQFPKCITNSLLPTERESFPSFICSSSDTNNQEISVKRTKQKKLITFGFVHKYSNSMNVIIPLAILDLICCFFFNQEYDAWCTQYIYSKDVAKISYDGTKLWISYYEVTLFSNSVVKMGEIHTFRIKILSFGKKEENVSRNAYLQPFIGIIKDDYDTLIQFRDDHSYWKVDEGYQFCCGGAIFGANNKQKNYGIKCYGKGDIIEIKVDLIEWKLSFIINNTDFGVACYDIDKSDYRLALSGVNVPAEFELF